MREHYMNMDKAIVIGLWVIVLGVAVVAATGLIWRDLDLKWMRAGLVLLVPLTGVTVVLHFRLYVLRLCSVMRATAGIERPDTDLRSVR